MRFELRPGEVLLQKEEGITCGENMTETTCGTLYLTNQRIAFAVLSGAKRLISEFFPIFAGNDIVWEANLNEITKLGQRISRMFVARAIWTPTATYSFVVNGGAWPSRIRDAVDSARKRENAS